MSWTCHEHAGAWSRSGSLQSGSGPIGLHPPAGAISSPVTGGPAAAAPGGRGGVGIGIGIGDPPSGRVVWDSGESPVPIGGGGGCPQGIEATAAADGHVGEGKSKNKPGGGSSNGSSSSNTGGQGRAGLGVFAKIKGRFSRHAG